MFSSWMKLGRNNQSYLIFIGVLMGGGILFYEFGRPLISVIVSVVIAYLLHMPQRRLEQKYGTPAMVAGGLTAALWLCLIGLFVWLFPLVIQQCTSLINHYPVVHDQLSHWLKSLPGKMGTMVEVKTFHALALDSIKDLAAYTVPSLQFILAVIPSMIEVVIYFFLVPMMVFFLLRDRTLFIQWFQRWLPKDRDHFTKFWAEVDEQLGNYLRGKSVEVLIIAFCSTVVYHLFSFQYALLLGLLSGLSVLIPVFGAILVTIPLFVLGYIQWGGEMQLWSLLIAHAVILVLDSNLLVPLLFSEAMSLHPFAILVAILFFGGIWGFWGLFFAIPLATVVHAILHAR